MPIDFPKFAGRIGLSQALLVVAPHPDDETLGCGGMIALARARGYDVAVVLVTDGSASHPDSITWPTARLAHQRHFELVAALRVLGVDRPPICLGLPDAQTQRLPAAEVARAQNKLARAIEAYGPDAVFTTWRREPHCDHRFAYTVTRSAVLAQARAPALIEYMVWTPVTGTPQDFPQPAETEQLSLDVEGVRDIKCAALTEHRSQLGHLISDDPAGFTLTAPQITAMTGPYEHFFLARTK